jgi:hypothetical protein
MAMPDGVVFALPTLGSGEMSKDDQAALIVNQATAVIVAAYLEHRSAAVAAGEAGDINSGTLVLFVNEVQNALRSF